ncbi:MAG: hypothetical protein RSB78_05480, partial [Oscillospiraceae bacterium]
FASAINQVSHASSPINVKPEFTLDVDNVSKERMNAVEEANAALPEDPLDIGILIDILNRRPNNDN